MASSAGWNNTNFPAAETATDIKDNVNRIRYFLTLCILFLNQIRVDALDITGDGVIHELGVQLLTEELIIE